MKFATNVNLHRTTEDSTVEKHTQ